MFARIGDMLGTLTSSDPSTPAARRQRTFAWQHIELVLPRSWDPVRIDGDFTAGRVEWADGRGPTLGLRWSTPRPRRLEPDVAARQALQNEVGMLAAAEAKSGSAAVAGSAGNWAGALLYEESTPPGRDVWSAFSRATQRLIQVVYFTQRRDAYLHDRLLPTLIDHPVGRATPWAIFDLDLVAPADATLAGHRFNAGDLSMRFNGPVGPWTIRQLAPATLALSRQGLDEWATAVPPKVGSGDRPLAKHYRRVRTTPAAESPTAEARSIWQRKRRFCWRPSLPQTRAVLASIDVARDRLLLLEGPDESLLGEIRQTVGCAV